MALALGGIAHTLRRRSRLAERLLRDRDPLEQEGAALPRGPGLLERLEREARQAGLNLTRRHLALAFGTSVGLAALFALAGDLTSAAALLLLGLVGPLLLVRHRARARAARFAEQLPETLRLMASVIRAGGTLYQAVQTVVQQAPQPMRGEFLRVERAMQLQVSAGDALAMIRERVGLRSSPAWWWRARSPERPGLTWTGCWSPSPASWSRTASSFVHWKRPAPRARPAPAWSPRSRWW